MRSPALSIRGRARGNMENNNILNVLTDSFELAAHPVSEKNREAMLTVFDACRYKSEEEVKEFVEDITIMCQEMLQEILRKP